MIKEEENVEVLKNINFFFGFFPKDRILLFEQI